MLAWSTHQLTEYFTAVNAAEDETSAIANAVERAAEMVDAEVGAVVREGGVHGAYGFGRVVPEAGVLEVAAGQPMLVVPNVGELHAVANPLGDQAGEALVVARLAEPFAPEERQMLQGMGQVLGLALRSIRVLAAERHLRAEKERQATSAQTRQRLVETLLTIQRGISARRPLPEILDAVTGGAADLLGGATVTLLLAEGGQERRLTIASTSGGGVTPPEGLARAAMAGGSALVRADARGQMIAAPVRVTGEMAGCLVALLCGVTDENTERRDQLAAFAQQVSLALTDARTVEAVREAHHDPVTGLPNRALFLTILHRVLASRATEEDPTSVLFVDLDRFKAVNDSLGHEAGDQLLALVARRLRGCVRASDTIARLGGDEFAALLHDSPVETATLIGERIVAAVKEPFRVAGREIFIGASVGVAVSREAALKPEELLHNADVAMYRAKKDGPGRVLAYQPYMHAEALDHLSLRGDLQRALRDGEFRLQYQPLIRLADGKPVGAEALIRWYSPTRGFVSPVDFIPIAEEFGLIIDIGQWALETSAVQVARWRRDFPDLGLNVNVSGHQLVHPRFADNVMKALAIAGLPSSAVTLELTESVLMSEPDLGKAALHQLRGLGVQLSIDDFGTGYSSLAYLRELPVDELKIDRAFIARAELTGEDLALVRTIVELAQILGLRVVAEGIENAAQLAALRRLGCGYGQGYHLCRPTDAAEVPAKLLRASIAVLG
ncbi:putative bifunctional diguanylate cyclase/phosphodiesterase [Paractinoplanes atraurantiacus]|uniref:Diguanylate cyclase (GGDEF) domain-containing protein n=1 Tax=Paractinoplanes atraurantiacus TaxID=1036182 RepID=A0A285EYM5_9ACTN|nr:EAL domain-containing protein [Actinoplanes atraurantiacus]SNY04160.1 diguanylate cyclase (GGDEF) domain-containing protein [Actinoplanes atraurantiacus]